MACRNRFRSAVPAAVVAAAVLLAAAPRPAAALAALTTTSPTDPLAPVVAAASLVTWLLAGWLLILCLLTLVEQVPGVAGRAAGAMARRVAPVAVRRTVAVVLGVTLSAGALGSTAASASPGAPGAGVDRAAVLDWPTARPQAAAPPTLDWAAPTRAAAPTSDVVVAPGDSLWAIAAEHLPAGADDAQIAGAWPAWWAANRDAIGADPDLIQPGTHLHTPPSGAS